MTYIPSTIPVPATLFLRISGFLRLIQLSGDLERAEEAKELEYAMGDLLPDGDPPSESPATSAPTGEEPR